MSCPNCFWKFPEDIETKKVETRIQTKNEPTVSRRDRDKYFENKIRIHRWMISSDSEVYVIKPSDRFYVV